MKTLLLPGFSTHNKEWAEKMKVALEPHMDIEIFYWPHWESGYVDDAWIEKQAEKLLSHEGPYMVLAKSVGTLVAVTALMKNKHSVSKILLCGVPLAGMSDTDRKKYQVLAEIDPNKVLIVQNKGDHLASHREVSEFFDAISERLKVVPKDRADHAYPYPEIFEAFLG